jgi:transcriptional regulator with XRE-family HTH domain
MLWLDNLKQLKTAKGMSVKQISEQTNLPERTLTRIFSGETESPGIDNLLKIVHVLGASLDCIFEDTRFVVASVDNITLQADIDNLNAEIARLNSELELSYAENSVLKDKVSVLTNENELLRIRLEHKEEIISLHNYYNKLMERSN